MVATTPEEVAANVLPPMTRLVGARAVFLLDADGSVIASHGDDAVFHRRDRTSCARTRRGLRRLGRALRTVLFRHGRGRPPALARRAHGLALDRTRLYVREREQRIALERADERMNFIALAAHELRTPVTSVPTGSSGRSTGSATGCRSRQGRAGGRASLANRAHARPGAELLDLSRLEADTVPIQPVRSRTGGGRELVAASASGREDEVAIEIPDDLEAVGRQDGLRASRLESAHERASARVIARRRERGAEQQVSV